jgi:hypothetical protein
MNADVPRHDAWQHDAPPAPVPRVEVLRLLVADAADRAAMMLAGDYPTVMETALGDERDSMYSPSMSRSSLGSWTRWTRRLRGDVRQMPRAIA